VIFIYHHDHHGDDQRIQHYNVYCTDDNAYQAVVERVKGVGDEIGLKQLDKRLEVERDLLIFIVLDELGVE